MVGEVGHIPLAKKRGIFKELWYNKALYLLALPAIAYAFIFSYMTLPYMVIAFQRFHFTTGIFSPFVGLQNFQHFFGSTWAGTVTRNTLVINFLFIFVGTIVAVFLAIILNEVPAKKFLKVSQSTMLFPYFISWVIVSFILRGLLATDTGFINSILVALGRERIPWYSSPQYWYAILLITHIWKNVGYTAIIYLAAISGIDEGLYEAAYVDGATRIKRIRYITLPLLMPVVSILSLMSVGRIFFGDFGMLYPIIRDNSALMPIAEVIDTYVFRVFRNTGDPSLAMAIGVYQSVVGFILVFTSNWWVRRKYPDGALF
jgi:putative aldouronate transport system permease protein